MKIKFPSFPVGFPRPTPRRHRQLRAGISSPEEGLGRREWVLSRPLFHFSRFDLKSVPKAQRPQALQLQIRQWAPFARAGSYVLWEQDCPLVWAWDAELVEAAMAANGLNPRGVTVLPETLLQKRRADGLFLVGCLEGCEGQVWRGGGLASSRWWPDIPGQSAWVGFQRDAGLSPAAQSAQVTALVPAHLEERAWGKSQEIGEAAAYTLQGLQWAVPVGALGLLVATMWFGSQALKLEIGIRERNAEIQALNESAAPVMAARGQALEAQARVHSLQAALDRFPDQVSLMAKVAQAMPADGTHLTEWEFQNGRLKLQIASAKQLPSSDYIKRLEAIGSFANVQATPASNATSLVLVMDVLPRETLRVAVGEGNPKR